jgi:hypothetical protein
VGLKDDGRKKGEANELLCCDRGWIEYRRGEKRKYGYLVEERRYLAGSV